MLIGGTAMMGLALTVKKTPFTISSVVIEQ
jgi:hypothetical protein